MGGKRPKTSENNYIIAQYNKISQTNGRNSAISSETPVNGHYIEQNPFVKSQPIGDTTLYQKFNNMSIDNVTADENLMVKTRDSSINQTHTSNTWNPKDLKK